MKYLGLDLGDRTCGVAVSDSLGMIATALFTIRFFDQDLDTCLNEVEKVVKEKNIDKIVLGYPLNMNGTAGPRVEYVLKFKQMLTDRLKIEVFLQDERLTTVEVNKIMISADVSRNKRKQKVDTLAATLILQSYLDTK